MKPEMHSGKYQPSRSTYLPKLNQKQFISKLVNFGRTLLQLTIQPSELKVWQTWDESGNVCWNGCDPLTQQSIYQVSEWQIRVWIEQRHHN